MNVNKPKVAIYLRLSEEDRNKKNTNNVSESIANQEMMLVDYATKMNWEIYCIYNDENWKGANRDRPGFNKILNLAEERKIDIILCKHQSRFTRELELVEKYINGLFLEWNIRFISLTDNADTNIKGNKKSRQINGMVNEWYIEDLSDNIKEVLTSKRKNGQYIGSVPLYGYLKDPNQKGHLIIDPIASKIVKQIFVLYNQGYGKTSIARQLNNEGIPNPTQYKLQQNITYKIPSNKLGTQWKYSSISNILSNEMYIGNMVQGKYGSISYKSQKNKPKPKDQWIRKTGTHEPIIDINLWNSVQKKINANFKPYLGGKVGLFAQKCKCMNCGYTLKSCKSHNTRYLRCPTRQFNKNDCKGCFISENLLKKVILNELNTLIKQFINLDQLKEFIISNQFKSAKEHLEKEIKNYQININKYSKIIKSSYIDKINGIITENQFTEINTDFNSQLESLKTLLIEKEEQLHNLENKQNSILSNTKSFQKYIVMTELSQEMIDNLINYIEVSEKNPVTKKKIINIHWKI